MSTVTAKLKLPIPDAGRVPTTEEVRLTRDILDASAQADWGQDVAGTSGHTYAYLGGVVQIDDVWVRIDGGTLAVPADTTRYVERRRTAPTVEDYEVRLVTEFSNDASLWIPMAKIVADDSGLVVTDMRPSGGTLQGPPGSSGVEDLPTGNLPKVSGGILVESPITDDGTTIYVVRPTEIAGGYLRITQDGGVQRLLMGNRDSGGTDTPSIIQAANAELRLGVGDSWNGDGGAFTAHGLLNATGLIVFPETQATDLATAALVCNGGASVVKNLRVGGTTYVGAALNVVGTATVGAIFTVDAGAGSPELRIKGSGAYPQIQFTIGSSIRTLFRVGDNLRWRYDGTNDGDIWHAGNFQPWTKANLSGATFTGAVALTGDVTTVQVGLSLTGWHSTAQICYSATEGVLMRTKTGSSYDFCLYSPGLGTVIHVPTGSRRVVFSSTEDATTLGTGGLVGLGGASFAKILRVGDKIYAGSDITATGRGTFTGGTFDPGSGSAAEVSIRAALDREAYVEFRKGGLVAARVGMSNATGGVFRWEAWRDGAYVDSPILLGSAVAGTVITVGGTSKRSVLFLGEADATSVATGSIICNGGVAVAKTLYVGGPIVQATTVSGAATATGASVTVTFTTTAGTSVGLQVIGNHTTSGATTAYVVGVYGRADVSSSSTTLSTVGYAGVWGYSRVAAGSASGNAPTCRGGVFGVINQNTSVTIPSAQAIRADSPQATGPITSAAGLSIANQKVAGVTNGYGILVDAQSAGGYSIFTNAGLVRLGDTSDATIGGAWAVGVMGGLYVAKTLVTAGGRATTSTTFTTNTTITDAMHLIYLNSASGFTQALPDAGTFDGRILRLENIGDGNVVLDPDSAQTINGSSTITLLKNQGVTLHAIGSNWRVLH